jgi:hypothetical protein
LRALNPYYVYRTGGCFSLTGEGISRPAPEFFNFTYTLLMLHFVFQNSNKSRIFRKTRAFPKKSKAFHSSKLTISAESRIFP